MSHDKYVHEYAKVLKVLTLFGIKNVQDLCVNY